MRLVLNIQKHPKTSHIAPSKMSHKKAHTSLRCQNDRMSPLSANMDKKQRFFELYAAYVLDYHVFTPDLQM